MLSIFSPRVLRSFADLHLTEPVRGFCGLSAGHENPAKLTGESYKLDRHPPIDKSAENLYNSTRLLKS